MRSLTSWHSRTRLLGACVLLMAGCGGEKLAITSPDVPGQQLTNPDPGNGVDGTFIPYIPPPTDQGGKDPIPAFTDPGMTSQSGQNSDGTGLGNPVYTPNDSGLDLLLDVQFPAGGGFTVDVEGSDGKTRLFNSEDGGLVGPGFTTGGGPGPSFDPGTGVLQIPLTMGTDASVYLTVTISTGQEQTNESHTIRLPQGWTPLDPNMGGTGAQMF